MLIADIVRRAGRDFGDAPAIEGGDGTMTFAEFDAATNRLANSLLETDLRPGDHVAVLLPNGAPFLVASHALARAGLVQVPLNVREAAEHPHRLADSESRALLGSSPAAGQVELVFDEEDLERMTADGSERDCDVPMAEGDLFRLSYTGGTTGPAKAVVSTPRQKTSEITHLLLDYIPDLGPGERFLHAAPVTHGSGAFFLPSLMRGCCTVILPSFRPPGFLELLERSRADSTFLVPTMLTMLLEEPNVEDVDTSSLRRLLWAASPLPEATQRRALEVFGPVLRGTYGQAEAPMSLTHLRADEHDRFGCAGRPYTLTEVRIVDDEGVPLPAGESGEVVARGDLVMTEYWKRPDATASAIAAGGWLRTGDIGSFDEDGYLYLHDRRGDMIISGGFNVYPSEVEDALLAHPGIRQAAVVGLPDPKWGERVHAVVSTSREVDLDELADQVAARLASYKKPRGITVWDELPQSGVGKILRRAVRERLLAQS